MAKNIIYNIGIDRANVTLFYRLDTYMFGFHRIKAKFLLVSTHR